MELYEMDPTGRFGSRAEAYRRYRPDYPDEAIEMIKESTTGLIVDLGAGTGIAAAQLAGSGREVIAVEPNAEMRTSGGEIDGVEWVEGSAEETGLATSSAGLVTAFQAYHWFNPEKALPEISRILRPGGLSAAVWNERDGGDGFTSAYGELVKRISSNHPAEARTEAARSLETSPLFTSATRKKFRHKQTLDLAGLIGRSASASYLPDEGPEYEILLEGLHQLFDEWSSDGYVEIRYETLVVRARVAK